MGGVGLDYVTQESRARVSSEIDRFERLVEQDQALTLRAYWTRRSPHVSLGRDEFVVCQGELIRADLRRRFRGGQSPAVSEYLQDFPDVRDAAGWVVELAYEEFCLREESGERLEVKDFCDRYPDWKASLEGQFRFDDRVSPNLPARLADAKPAFPSVGEWFEEFELLEKIGEGAYSHVFIARDRSLGGKRVVLKVSVDRGQEPETQGALDHPHIVPVNSVVYETDLGLRGLSMPYRPGLPLDDVMRRLQERHPARGRKGRGGPTSARALWEALATGIGPAVPGMPEEVVAALQAGPVSDGWRGFPVGGSFAQGAAWLGMVLARTLAYAHDNRTYHRDVKPGNVLLTIQHGPQLLDFNLARSPHANRGAESAIQGGTLPYMAPEQIEAFLSPVLWEEVGAGADIYSLGLVLHEVLTGRPPRIPDRTQSPDGFFEQLLSSRRQLSVNVRQLAPRTPHALEAIVRKCLRYESSERYQSAGDLAEDLERFLQHRPLAHAVNPSRVEMGLDWTTRNRRILAVNALYLAAFAAISPLLVRQAALLMLPAPQNRPEFLRAMQAVDASYPRQPILQLERFAHEYPDSPLPLVYLGLAHRNAESPPFDPVKVNFADAMKIPEAREKLVAWGLDYPQLAERLRELGDYYLTKHDAGIDQFGVDADADGPESEEISLAGHAYSIALEINPSVHEATVGLARIEEHRKQYELAYDRLTLLLEQWTSLTHKKLSRWSVQSQRSRIANALAKKIRDSDVPDRLERALELADSALADQRSVARSLPDIVVSQMNYLGLHTESLLVRCDLYRRLNRSAEQADDYRAARTAMEAWFQLLSSEKKSLSEGAQEAYRKRLSDLEVPSRIAGTRD